MYVIIRDNTREQGCGRATELSEMYLLIDIWENIIVLS